MKQTEGQRIYGVARTLMRQDAKELHAALDRYNDRPASIRRWARMFFDNRRAVVAKHMRTLGASPSVARRFSDDYCREAVAIIRYALREDVSLVDVADSWTTEGPRYFSQEIKAALPRRRKAVA